MFKEFIFFDYERRFNTKLDKVLKALFGDDKCNFYLSVTQLFVWSSHRYQNLWAKRLLLDKASGLLGKAILALGHVVEPDQNTELSKTLAKEFVGIWGRYQKLASQGEEKAI